MKLCQFWIRIVNVELEVGLSNPFVSEYPIARLASEYWYSTHVTTEYCTVAEYPAL